MRKVPIPQTDHLNTQEAPHPMSTPKNLWHLLPESLQDELLSVAEAHGTDTIYLWKRLYYPRRNTMIIHRYHQLCALPLTKQQIYEQIARELSSPAATVSAKAVAHVIATGLRSRNT